MAIKLRSTADVQMNGVKALVYGMSGSGKTTLIKTLPNPIIISAESGLLSLAGTDIQYLEVSSFQDLQDAYQWIMDNGQDYKSIAIDSLSEIGEVVLAYEKSVNKDGRAAYGELAVKIIEIMRAFRDISGKNVMFIAKAEKSQDENGRMLYQPSMPGAKLSQQLPYLVDLVLALRTERDADGAIQRALMCQPDGLWQAKDRSGKLEPWEAPDLGAIIAKIEGVTNE